jgi:hypothetical protein
MKNVWFLLAAICLALHGYGQAPQVLHYQGIARNAQGAPLAGATIAIRLSIKDAPNGGITLYSERKSTTTNAFGLYSVSINDGGGTRTGDFNAIQWQTGPKYLQTEIDPANGTAFVEMGTVQIQSVPFALQAGKAANLNGVTNPVEGDVMEYRQGSWVNKRGVRRYKSNGVGNNPTNDINFISPTITFTVEANSPTISISATKSLGSTSLGGGTALYLNLGYRKINGGSITPFDVNDWLPGLRVSAGTSVPFTHAGTYNTTFLIGETYQVGLIANSSNPNSWSDNGLGTVNVEVSY